MLLLHIFVAIAHAISATTPIGRLRLKLAQYVSGGKVNINMKSIHPFLSLFDSAPWSWSCHDWLQILVFRAENVSKTPEDVSMAATDHQSHSIALKQLWGIVHHQYYLYLQ